MRNRWIARVLVIAVVVGAFMGFGFRINHLQGGIGSALGSAQSSLAVYKHGTSADVGSKIIVNVKDSGPELGIVKSATATTVDVDLGDSFLRLEKTEILGKLIAVIPFFGSVMGIVGL